MIHSDDSYLSVFNVLKRTRRTPLGIFKDFITSAVIRRTIITKYAKDYNKKNIKKENYLLYYSPLEHQLTVLDLFNYFLPKKKRKIH